MSFYEGLEFTKLVWCLSLNRPTGVELIYIYMDKLPPGIGNHTFLFIWRPAADAIRDMTAEFHAFSNQHEKSDLRMRYT